MKNLHKKIIAGALIGVISVGGVALQGSKVFAADWSNELSGPVNIDDDEKQASLDYLQYALEWFGYEFNSVSSVDNQKVDKFFRNPGDFIQHLYDDGKNAGEAGYYWIAGDYYHFSFKKKIDVVPYWKQWEEDNPPLVRFYEYYYDRIQGEANVHIFNKL